MLINTDIVTSLFSPDDKLMVQVQTDNTKPEMWVTARLATDLESKKYKFDKDTFYVPLTILYGDGVIIDNWIDVTLIKKLVIENDAEIWKQYQH